MKKITEIFCEFIKWSKENQDEIFKKEIDEKSLFLEIMEQSMENSQNVHKMINNRMKLTTSTYLLQFFIKTRKYLQR